MITIQNNVKIKIHFKHNDEKKQFAMITIEAESSWELLVASETVRSG